MGDYAATIVSLKCIGIGEVLSKVKNKPGHVANDVHEYDGR